MVHCPIDLTLDSVTALPAAAAASEGTAEYRIFATACPQILLRVLGLFAQQDRLPVRVRSDLVDDSVAIHLLVASLSKHRAEIVAEKVRSIIGIELVTLFWHPGDRGSH